MSPIKCPLATFADEPSPPPSPDQVGQLAAATLAAAARVKAFADWADEMCEVDHFGSLPDWFGFASDELRPFPWLAELVAPRLTDPLTIADEIAILAASLPAFDPADAILYQSDALADVVAMIDRVQKLARDLSSAPSFGWLLQFAHYAKSAAAGMGSEVSSPFMSFAASRLGDWPSDPSSKARAEATPCTCRRNSVSSRPAAMVG
jgi:hypothetical protein